jgi:transcriptional enhancer factor
VLKGKQQGRNELIKEYLWIAYSQSLPPGAEKDPGMKRGRKQVSSHIQVLKNFFTHHRCCESTPALIVLVCHNPCSIRAVIE